MTSARRARTRERGRVRPAVALVGSVLVLACSDGLGPEAADLQRNRAKWAAAAVDNYVYDYRRICFCPPETTRPVRIQVESSRVTAVVSLESGEPLDQPDLDPFPTIDELFAQLESAIEGGADSIDVTYHRQLGYPTEAFIDFDLRIADEEQGFTAGRLDLLESLTDDD